MIRMENGDWIQEIEHQTLGSNSPDWGKEQVEERKCCFPLPLSCHPPHPTAARGRRAKQKHDVGERGPGGRYPRSMDPEPGSGKARLNIPPRPQQGEPPAFWELRQLPRHMQPSCHPTSISASYEQKSKEHFKIHFNFVVFSYIVLRKGVCIWVL